MTLSAMTADATIEKSSSTMAWAIVVVAPASRDASPLEERDDDGRDAGQDDAGGRDGERHFPSGQRRGDDEGEGDAKEDQDRQDREVVNRRNDEIHLFTPGRCDVFNQLVHGGRNAVQDGLGKNTQHHDKKDDRHQDPLLLGVASAMVAFGPSALPWKTRW